MVEIVRFMNYVYVYSVLNMFGMLVMNLVCLKKFGRLGSMLMMSVVMVWLF